MDRISEATEMLVVMISFKSIFAERTVICCAGKSFSTLVLAV